MLPHYRCSPPAEEPTGIFGLPALKIRFPRQPGLDSLPTPKRTSGDPHCRPRYKRNLAGEIERVCVRCCGSCHSHSAPSFGLDKPIWRNNAGSTFSRAARFLYENCRHASPGFIWAWPSITKNNGWVSDEPPLN